jgi:hypothetical protein
MATHAAVDVTTWLSGYDLTGDSNQTSLDIEYDPLDDTAYGDSARSRLAGLEAVQAQVNGFWQAGSGTVDPEAFTGLGSTLQVVTQSPDGDESSVAYFWQAKKFSYQMFGEVGQVNPFSLSAQSARGNGTLSAGAVRGRVVKTKGNVSATGATGTSQNLGAVGATQFLYGAFHVFSAGTTITAVLESAAASDFVGATTRITFGPITTTGGTWGTRVAGVVTDTWYRLRVTAITGTFSIAAVVGIK